MADLQWIHGGFKGPWRLLNGRTLVCLGAAADLLESPWTSGGSARRTFPTDSSGPAEDSGEVRRGPKNPPGIHHKYAAEWWTCFSKNKIRSAGFGELVFAAD